MAEVATEVGTEWPRSLKEQRQWQEWWWEQSKRGVGAKAEEGWMTVNSQRRETASHNGWESVRELPSPQSCRLRVPAPEACFGSCGSGRYCPFCCLLLLFPLLRMLRITITAKCQGGW